MTGCAAVGCGNSSSKGFVMEAFPRDAEKRKIWAAAVNRVNWEPTIESRLCEVHFDAECWEKTRVDGSHRLKLHAIPTLFPDVSNRHATSDRHKSDAPNIGETSTTSMIIADDTSSTEKEEQEVSPHSMIFSDNPDSSSMTTDEAHNFKLGGKLTRCETLLRRNERLRKLLKKKLRVTRLENERLNEQWKEKEGISTSGKVSNEHPVEMNPGTTGSLEIKEGPFHHNTLEQPSSYQEATDLLEPNYVKVEPHYPKLSSSPHEPIKEEEGSSKQNDKPMTLILTSGEQKTSVSD